MKKFKYLFGSKMLKLDNNHDEDWVNFTTEDTRIARETGYQSIPFYQTILRHFIRGKNIKVDSYNALYLYQLSAPFINEIDYPFNEFNILEHKEVWVKWLKAYMNSEAIEQSIHNQENLYKTFYHILYQYYMIIEDVHFISNEARAKVQKIHDLEMPSSYFYELRDLINSL